MKQFQTDTYGVNIRAIENLFKNSPIHINNSVCLYENVTYRVVTMAIFLTLIPSVAVLDAEPILTTTNLTKDYFDVYFPAVFVTLAVCSPGRWGERSHAPTGSCPFTF